jgi:type II secretory pathway component PulF
MRDAILRACLYPIFLLIGIIVLFWIMDLVLVQKIAALGLAPAIEALSGFAAACAAVKAATLPSIAALVVIVTLFHYALPNWTGRARVFADRIIPFSVYRMWNGAGFLVSLAGLLRSGMALSRALLIIEQSATPWLRQRVFSARGQVLAGASLGEALLIRGLGFPDPSIGRDLLVSGDRIDLPDYLERITQRWMKEQVRKLDRTAQAGRLIVLLTMAAVLCWCFSAILGMAAAALNIRA